MKACFVCSEYPPSLHGGIGTYTRVLGRALRHRGHEVRVIGVYPHGQDEPVQRIGEPGHVVHPLGQALFEDRGLPSVPATVTVVTTPDGQNTRHHCHNRPSPAEAAHISSSERKERGAERTFQTPCPGAAPICCT